MTDTPRGPTTEELRARVLAHEPTRCEWGPWLSDPEAFGGTPHRLCSCGKPQWSGEADPHTARLLPRPCLACNREQGERMCDLCQRLEAAEASA